MQDMSVCSQRDVSHAKFALIFQWYQCNFSVKNQRIIEEILGHPRHTRPSLWSVGPDKKCLMRNLQIHCRILTFPELTTWVVFNTFVWYMVRRDVSHQIMQDMSEHASFSAWCQLKYDTNAIFCKKSKNYWGNFWASQTHQARGSTPWSAGPV